METPSTDQSGFLLHQRDEVHFSHGVTTVISSPSLRDEVHFSYGVKTVKFTSHPTLINATRCCIKSRMNMSSYRITSAPHRAETAKVCPKFSQLAWRTTPLLSNRSSVFGSDKLSKYTAAPAEHAGTMRLCQPVVLHGDNLATKHRLWIDLTQSANVLNARSVESLL